MTASHSTQRSWCVRQSCHVHASNNAVEEIIIIGMRKDEKICGGGGVGQERKKKGKLRERK